MRSLLRGGSFLGFIYWSVELSCGVLEACFVCVLSIEMKLCFFNSVGLSVDSPFCFYMQYRILI